MEKQTHTPGPWKITRKLGISFGVSREGDYTGQSSAFATVAKTYTEANARLIAAAPELLESAEKWEAAELAHANCNECGGEGDWAECGPCSELFGDAIDLRHAAIAKATGAA